MRSSRVVVKTSKGVTHLLQRNPTRTIFLLINSDPINTLSLQFGAAGDPNDFWPVPAGQVFVLDPTNPVFAKIIQQDIFIYSAVADIACYMMVG